MTSQSGSLKRKALYSASLGLEDATEIDVSVKNDASHATTSRQTKLRSTLIAAELLIQTQVIIWDEAPMSDRRCYESLDRSLRDILDRPDVPFGGKTVLLGGDFRQTLPVKRKASKAEIISTSLPRSYLWPSFRIIKLTENMRLHRPHLTSNESQQIASFSNWLLDIGDGVSGDSTDPLSPDSKNVVIPQQFLIPHDDSALTKLIDFIYNDSVLQFPTAENLSDKAIICPKNETANYINGLILEKAPGQIFTYLSTDSITPRTGDRGDTEMLYPPDYLNQLNFSGIPSHQLNLKVNSPVILMRNLNQTCGLCNGTRLLISQLLPKVIEATIITGNAIGQRVYIPRIAFIHNDKELPFVFRRRQFPLRMCYAMTINKSQGQSLNKIGIYLPQNIFCHGQLYVALSRATSPQSLKLLIVPQDDFPVGTTKNIVYSDFLKEIEIVTPHRAALKIGKATTIIPMTEINNIPHHYFNFVPYNDLTARVYHDKILTEIASLVDIEALTNKKQHVVAAISSLRVSEFKGKIQMASTSATRVHTDPDINIAKTILARYCITATIADETSSTAVTIFDQAAKTLIGISCFDMVVQQGYTEPTIIPPAILSLIGQPKIFQLQQPRDHNIGRKRFNVNRVFINNSNTTAADPELGPRAATKRQLFVDPAQESAIIKHHKNNDFD
ncbi:hypothetical protein E3N88_16350 [Mikania micrantha]|uniref:ATP-dependent DNA helicase n=1 Tax=Mikania micrantha TaxID=192012 RepID=A0A5N6NY31_9ASTR|nr:hypothetical protein E3N88_16350 [Mikania micrantha]